jgi:formylglycine-generating enzyme required for sulfatase activity
MGIYPVTQAQYEAVMGTNPNTGNLIGVNRPVINVNWYHAIVFCNRLSISEGLTPAYRIPGYGNSTDPEFWISSNFGNIPTSSNATWNAVEIVPGSTGYRLPTEAQWEYACRGDYPNKATETATKPFGIGNGTSITGDIANFWSSSPYDALRVPAGHYTDSSETPLNRTSDVGDYAANNYGLYDMHGNVYEWCWDWSGSYTVEAKTDPTGALASSFRVIRGGSWSSVGRYLRSAYRGYDFPDYGNFSVGFRLVRP